MDGKIQHLVYSMNVGAAEAKEVAMILPLPVPISCSEDAVNFVNLDGYPNFFEHLAQGFVPQTLSKSRSRSKASTLKVHDVGAYVASFVPAVKDFERLHEGFRLSADVWAQLQEYRDWGFAVFQLKLSFGKLGMFGSPRSDTNNFHPMALTFPNRHPEQLYFPTKHVHDGTVPKQCIFDHVLYSQPEQDIPDWSKSNGEAKLFANISLSRGILDADKHVFRRKMMGTFENGDVIVSVQ